MPADLNNPLSHPAISIDEARRIWEEQPEEGVAMEEAAEPTVAGPTRLVDPPEPVNPLVALMQQMNDNINGKFSGLDGKFWNIDRKFMGLDGKMENMDGKFAGLNGRFVEVHPELRPMKSDISSLFDKQKIMKAEIAALKSGQMTKGTHEQHGDPLRPSVSAPWFESPNSWIGSGEGVGREWGGSGE